MKAKIMKGNGSSLECSAVGWKKLCAENLVGVGEICICEIVEGCSSLDILVNAFRALLCMFSPSEGEKEKKLPNWEVKKVCMSILIKYYDEQVLFNLQLATNLTLIHGL